MSYDPKTATITEPSESLRRDITLLTPEQKLKLYDEINGDLPDSAKPELAGKVAQVPDLENHEKRIKGMDDQNKINNVDFVALKLTPEQQKDVSAKVAKMLKEAQEENEPNKKLSGPDFLHDADEDKPSKHHATHHKKEHAHAR